MRWGSWVWFAGCGAWVLDGLVAARLHAWPRAQLAFMVAMVFLAAGLFYRRQRR